MLKNEFYNDLIRRLASLLSDENDLIINTANTAALLYESLDGINWAGFYFLKEKQLLLGPFQGKPACKRIALGHGVCGTAAEKCETIVVPDVHKFPGHIACDSASKSEIVVPLVSHGRLLGVLDIDSPLLNRFDVRDRKGLEKIADTLVRACI